MEIIRNMWRRKFRTLLTISGIAIGIFALTVMGSMALKLNKMIDGGKRYITGQISIMPKGSSYYGASGSATLPVDTLNKISKVDGVKAVAAEVNLSLEEPDPDNPSGSFQMGSTPTIVGMDASSDFKNANWSDLEMRDGKMIDNDTSDNEIVVGYSIAVDKKIKNGDTMKIRGKNFKVVGILEQTMTGPDQYVMMQIKPVRDLFVESNPFLKSLKNQAEKADGISNVELAQLPLEIQNQIIKAKSFNINDISTSAAVSWKDGYDSEKVVNNIKDEYKKEVVVFSPKKMGEQIDKASSTMNAIILGSALLALIVGLFSIVNTMIMSISERTKEIGVKKALGASNISIAREYTLEAGIIGLVGGTIGMGLGTLTALLINDKMASSGAEIFLIDPKFMIEVVIFSFLVGIVAGILPAIRASRLKVVDAIREL